MSKSKKTFYYLQLNMMTYLLLVAFLIIGFFLGAQYQKSIDLQNKDSFKEEKYAWKTYSDSDMGLTFKYPENMVITKESGTPEYLLIANKRDQWNRNTYGVRVGIVETTANYSFDNYIDGYYSTSSSEECGNVTDLEKTQFSSRNAYVFEQRNCFNNDSRIYTVLNEEDIYYISGFVSSEDTENNWTTVNKILESFDFVE